MSVKFIGYIGFNNTSELHSAERSRALDRDYIEAAAEAQEKGGFDRVLIPFGSISPDSLIVAAHAAAFTTRSHTAPASPSRPSRRASWRRWTRSPMGASRSTSSLAARTPRWRATATPRPRSSATPAPTNMSAS